MKALSAPITDNIGADIPKWKPKGTTTSVRRTGFVTG